MDKYSKLKELIELYNPQIHKVFDEIAYNNPGLTLEKFLITISKDKYNLKTELGISSTTVTRCLTKIFPTRITGSTGDKPCNFLLGLYHFKWCGRCRQVLPFDSFRKNSALKYGLNSYCKECHASTTASTQAFRQKTYQSAKLHRTPLWANLDIIKRIYECAEGDHVDHIIPLQGDMVCGLHVETNLQYLSPHDNMVKHNKFKTDWEL